MNITLIGGGNMASALIGGLLQRGYSAQQLRVIEINVENRNKINQAFGISVFPDLTLEAIASDVVLLSVKPQQLFQLAQKLAPLLRDQLVISIAAGISTVDIIR